MKSSRLLLLVTLIAALEGGGLARVVVHVFPNASGSFNFPLLNQRPAQEQVDLAAKSCCDGAMASLPGNGPVTRLREFPAAAALPAGSFKIYAVRWWSHIAQPFDERFPAECVVVAKELKTATGIDLVVAPGERELTISHLRLIADCCRAGSVPLVLYPHDDGTFENAEESLDVLQMMKRPEAKRSMHLCHELKMINQDRFEAIVAKVGRHLAPVSLNGADTSADYSSQGWVTMVIPLDKGDYDPRLLLAVWVRHGHRGPILLHNLGFKAKPEEDLPGSMRCWRESSADVARAIATESAKLI